MRDSQEARPGRRGTPTGRRRNSLVVTGLSVALCLFAAACQARTAASGSATSPPARPTPAKPAAQVSVKPAGGAHTAATNHGVKVTVAHGKLTRVVVKGGGTAVPGTMGSGDTSWHTLWPLHTSTHYHVSVTAVGTDGKTVTRTSSFRTAAPTGTIYASTFEGYHQVYGVGMPIMINFNRPVTHKKAVEHAIEIKTSTPVVGAWMWDGDQVLDFRPRTYWPQHTTVTFVAHFNGVEAAPGVYGTADLSQTFRIGNSLIVVANTRTHYQKVYYKNKLLGRWPISTGQPGLDTANGTYLTIEKHNPTRMKGNGYNELVPYAVRFTWSGNYEHWAGWSVAQQGHVNVSHGCVNLSPADSKVYYNLARPGDPVTIIGSPVAGKWDDGWTEWFLSWKALLHRSATHKAVEAGPDGSKFVSPSSLPASVPDSRLDGSKPGNYLAS